MRIPSSENIYDKFFSCLFQFIILWKRYNSLQEEEYSCEWLWSEISSMVLSEGYTNIQLALWYLN
jgi:hypothetical protein